VLCLRGACCGQESSGEGVLVTGLIWRVVFTLSLSTRILELLDECSSAEQQVQECGGGCRGLVERQAIRVEAPQAKAGWPDKL